MKVLMIGWKPKEEKSKEAKCCEYYIAAALKKLGHEVHVLTVRYNEEALTEEIEGIIIHRVSPYNLPKEDFSKWIMHLNFAMLEEGIRLVTALGKFDIIHCENWTGLYTAKVLKNVYNIPIIASMSSTEHGRNGGIKSELQHYISSAEWMLTYEAWSIIAFTEAVREELQGIFNVPEDKIFVISNGGNEDNAFEVMAKQINWVYEKVKEETKGTQWDNIAKAPRKRSTTTKKNIEKKAEVIKESEKAIKPKRTRKKSEGL